MRIVKMQPKMLSQKLIANVSKEFASAYDLPKNHQSVGMFSVDNDNAAYIAIDDATKKADIKVIRAESFYGGDVCSWTKYGGSIFSMISGKSVEDVKLGLIYIREFIDNHSQLFNIDGDEKTSFYAQCIPRAGKYFAEYYEVQEGSSYAYLFGGPVETNYALDKALKAGETEIKKYWYPPTSTNLSGAILTGCESACCAAVEAFKEGIKEAVESPL